MVFGVLLILCILIDRARVKTQNSKYIAKAALERSELLCLADGKKIKILTSLDTQSPPHFGFMRGKKFKSKQQSELDEEFAREMLDLLEKFLVLTYQNARFKVLRKHAKLLFRYPLEWLCLRNDKIPRDQVKRLYSKSLSKVLVTLHPHEPELMRSWFDRLDFWCEKFSTSGHFQLPLALEDIPKFKGFIFLFLHDIKARSETFEKLLNRKYPIQATPEQNLSIQVQPTSQPAKNPKLSRIRHYTASRAGPRCPICKKPFEKNRKGLLWCPRCIYFLDYIVIGHRKDSYLHELSLIKISDLTKHGIILGGTNMGKSNTALIIVFQLREHGVPCWIFECDKDHFRQLKNMHLRNPNVTKDFVHFTPKKWKINPCRINPLIPPPGCSVETQLEHFTAIFEFAYELELWAATQFKQAVIKAYKDKGWDLMNDQPPSGKADDLYPLPLELFEKVDAILANQYSLRARQDVRGVLFNRLRDFNRTKLGKMFNCQKTIPWSELITKNVVFELHHMDDDRAIRFFVCLMLTMLYEYMKVLGKHKGLKLLVIIEEASTVLTREKEKSEGGITVEIIETIVSKSRAYGLGMVIIDQTPEKLPYRVRAIPQTGIIHNLKNEESISMVYRIFARDIKYLPKTDIGEAKFVTPSIARSHDVRINWFPESEDPTYQEMRDHMESFYKAHQWMKTVEPDILEKITAATLSSTPTPHQMQAEGLHHTDLLMGLTKEDLDEMMEANPLEIDNNCADLENHFFSSLKSIRPHLKGAYFSLTEKTKRTLRSRYQQPQARNVIRKLQDQLMHEDSSHDQQEILRSFFHTFSQWGMFNCESPDDIAVTIYLLRLICFKFIRLTIDKRWSTFYAFLEILVEDISQNANCGVRFYE